MSHLYVMQNHMGLIKVGRSVNVEARRKAIELTHQCTVSLVAVVMGGGESEKAIHLALDDHRCLGEWFDGTVQARQDVITQVGIDPATVWPVALADDAAVENWLTALSERMHLTSRDKEVQKVIREMATYGPPSPNSEFRWKEAQLFTTYWRSIRMLNAGVSVGEDCEGRTTYDGCRDNGSGGWIEESVPHYFTDLDAALSLWPDANRPAVWDGSAWDCCLAALKAQKARLGSAA